MVDSYCQIYSYAVRCSFLSICPEQYTQIHCDCDMMVIVAGGVYSEYLRSMRLKKNVEVEDGKSEMYILNSALQNE